MNVDFPHALKCRLYLTVR
uniref:CSON007951 protein n=1 Tax=Culicoides sonorensis TaxID=179676 RepID=A0A336K1V7_CULSO